LLGTKLLGTDDRANHNRVRKAEVVLKS